MKHYIAVYTDGHDIEEFEFTSEYRANSKRNIEDCKYEFARKHGFKRAAQIDVISTRLVK